MNYCDLLFQTENKDLDREIIIDAENGKRIDFKGLEEQVLKVAGYLKAKGYKPGTVISTHIYNSAEAVIAFLAIQYIGCVVCLIDPLFTAEEVPYYIQDSCSKCIFTYLEKDQLEGVAKSGVEVINADEIEKICRAAVPLSYKKLEMYSFNKDELAMLLYTSGSTSTPKGVMLTTGCFYTFLDKNHKSMYRYEPEDRLLCFVPFSHGFGSISLLIPALAYKAAIVFLKTFHPVKVVDTIIKEKITHIFGVPTHYQQLLRYNAINQIRGKLKAAFCSAAPLNCDVVYSWYEKTGVYLDEGYGMSESTTLISTRMSRIPEESGNVGYPPDGIIELQVVDEKDRLVEDEVIGELRLTGEGLMLGYFNRPKETEERLKNGWLYTGDLGYRKGDGSFVVCGRKTEFINVAGLKISPVEVEIAMNSHTDVIDSVAVGVYDETYGEIVKAFVIKKEESALTERELIKYLSKKLAKFKVPKYISYVAEFPRNNIGKIDRKALKNM
jgi:long-chain acyl-CoA synthetase